MDATALGRLPARIAAKITVTDDGCWLWTGYIQKNGYGKVWHDGAKRLAHRVVYTLLVGPIPSDRELDHVRANGCRSRACVNPSHLEPVTAKENQARGAGNQHRGRTHCQRGHEFTPENTIIQGGGRACRACVRLNGAARQRAHRARRRAAAQATSK